MKPAFEIESLGVNYPDYFQGFGVAFTPYEHCATGIGDTEAEAYDDACECIAQCLTSAQFAALGLPDEWGGEDSAISDDADYSMMIDEETPHYYVGIRYNIATEV